MRRDATLRARQHAPLYVLSHELVVALSRLGLPTGEPATRMLGAAHDLLESVSLALATWPGREAQLGRADAAVVRVRVHLRVLVALGVISEGASLPLHDRLAEAGRMIGGWRRQLRRAHAHPEAIAACAVATSTTPLTGAVRPGATGTSPGGPTPTSASASCSPPPLDPDSEP